MDIYDRIKQLCDEAGIAITALETELNFGRGSLGKLKTGKVKTLSSQRAKMIAEKFGVSADWILGTSDVRKSADFYIQDNAAVKSEAMLEKQRILMESVAKLSEEQMDALIAVATQLKGTNPDG